jgi:asparagine synthase (glutamine-hydrolysing)
MCSREVREPFLDHRIVELGLRQPPERKIRDGQGKWLLRQALRRLVGDDLGIVNRRIKHGLPAPVNLWLFKTSAFDRRDWNALLFGECLKQLAQAHDPAAG